MVQVGHVPTIHGGGLNLNPGVEGFVGHLAGHNILQLGTHESGPLTRLHMLEFHNLLEFIVDLEHKTILKISGCCHAGYFLHG